MFDTTKLIADVQELLDQALATDAVTDAAERQAQAAAYAQQLADAMAADAAADKVVTDGLNARIAKLEADLAACQAGSPPAGDTTAPSAPVGLNAAVVLLCKDVNFPEVRYATLFDSAPGQWQTY